MKNQTTLGPKFAIFATMQCKNAVKNPKKIRQVAKSDDFQPTKNNEQTRKNVKVKNDFTNDSEVDGDKEQREREESNC